MFTTPDLSENTPPIPAKIKGVAVLRVAAIKPNIKLSIN
jgi:hypothetical protein